MIMVSFKCSDIENDCCFEIHSGSISEINRQIIDHFHENHNVKVIPAEIMLKVKNSIKP